MDWLNFLTFTIVSSLEYTSMIVFIAVLFRFRYFLKMKMHIFMACILLSYVSYTTRTIYDFTILASLIQIILMVLFIWLLFKVQIYYSFFITVAGYAAFAMIQFIFLVLFTTLNVFTTDDLANLRYPSHLLPISSSLLICVISWIIYKKNWGFSFVPDGHDSKLKYDNYIVLGLITFIFLFFITLNNMVFNLLVNIYITSIFYIVAFAAVIIYSIRREKKND